jgi:hypothetical protein
MSGPTAMPAAPTDWLTITVTVVGMLLVAVVAWKTVQRSERGDADLEAKLTADDERAAEGRARGE